MRERGFYVMLALTSVLGIALTAFLVYKAAKLPSIYSPKGQEPVSTSSANQASSSITKLPDVSVLNTPISVVDWKIYTNSKFGFSFGYPKTWKLDVKEQTLSRVRATRLSFLFTTDLLDERGEPRWGGFNLIIYQNSQNLPLDEWIRNNLEDNEGFLQLVPPKIQIQGAEEILAVANEDDFYAKKGKGSYPHTDYFIKHNPYVYDFTWFYQVSTYNMKVLENQFFPHFTLEK